MQIHYAFILTAPAVVQVHYARFFPGSAPSGALPLPHIGKIITLVPSFWEGIPTHGLAYIPRTDAYWPLQDTVHLSKNRTVIPRICFPAYKKTALSVKDKTV
jgi:hypothetical protein